MSEPYKRVATTREEAHAFITSAYAVAKLLLQDGKRVRIEVAEDDDRLSARQRRFLHGPVLTQVSEQARDDGKRYVPRVWKEYFRGLFLGSRWESIDLPGGKGPRAVEVRVSTEDLTAKQYSDYIDKVLAHAATDWGVRFQFLDGEREAVRYITQRKEKATC